MLNRLQRLARLAALAVAGAVCGAAAFAQDGASIPAHKLERNTARSSCTVTLIPEMRSSDDSPLLVITSGGAGKPGVLGIDAGSETRPVELQFVARNKRVPFQAMPPKEASVVARSALWKELDAIHKAGAPFFLTARMEDGSWTSSRYEKVDPLGIIRLLEQNCDFRSAQLTARSTADLAADEKALGLRPDDYRHIRWVLTRKFDPTAGEPILAATFSSSDRLKIERYAKSVGQPASQYLDRTLANMLLSEPFQPAPFNYGSMRRVTYHGDWTNYTDPSDGRCHMASSAYSWTSGPFFRAPRMVFSADVTSPRDLMYFSMVEPNPFLGSERLVAIVDGRTYRLQIERETWVKPATEGSGLSDAVMKAMARGSLIQISGTQKGTRVPLTLSFSALGFTASFKQLMADCGRPGLREWLR